MVSMITMQTVFLGDFNEWRPWLGLAFSPKLVGLHLQGPAWPGFPTRAPVLPLDRILTDRPKAITEFKVINNPLTNRASDHRPLTARVAITRP